MSENLVLIRDFLFKWFIVGFGLFLLSVILYIFMKDFSAEMSMKLYNVEPQYYFNLAFTLLGFLKLFLFFGVLSPALAIHWLIKVSEKK